MPEIKGRGSIVRLEDKPRARCRKWRLVVDMGVDPVLSLIHISEPTRRS